MLKPEVVNRLRNSRYQKQFVLLSKEEAAEIADLLEGKKDKEEMMRLQTWTISYNAETAGARYTDTVKVAALSIEQAISFAAKIHPKAMYFNINDISRTEQIYIAISDIAKEQP